MSLKKDVSINVSDALEIPEKEIIYHISEMKYNILNNLNESVKVYEKDYIILLSKIFRLFVYNLEYSEAIINLELLLKEDIEKNPKAILKATNILYFEVLALRHDKDIDKEKYQDILKYFELKLKDKV